MEVTGAFNAAAGNDPPPAAPQGEGGPAPTQGGAAGSPSLSAEFARAAHNAAPADAPATQTGVAEARPAAKDFEETPDPAAINAMQDRHFDEIGSFHTERYHARDRMLSDFAERYGARERQLDREISEREGILENSSRARLFWLRLTKQIPKNAAADLDEKRREVSGIRWQREGARRTFDAERDMQLEAIRARHHAERHAPTSSPKAGLSAAHEVAAAQQASPGEKISGGQDPKAKTPTAIEQARAKLESLESQRAQLDLEHEMPAPESVAHAVNRRTEEKLAIEISKLKMWLRSADVEESEAELEEEL